MTNAVPKVNPTGSPALWPKTADPAIDVNGEEYAFVFRESGLQIRFACA
jgi:hypothetical protein